MPYEQILFDVDGTLIDSREGIIASVQYAMGKAGRDTLDPKTIQKTIGMPLIPMIQALVPDLDEENSKQMAVWYREYFSDRGVMQHQVYDGVAELLAKLHEAKKTLTVVTSKPLPFTERVLEKLDFRKYFCMVYAPEVTLKTRKKGEFIADFLKESGVDLTACVMIGDRAEDINAAGENGMSAIGVTYGFGSQQELENAGAIKVADNAVQLGEMLLS